MNVLDLKADIFRVPSLGLAYAPDTLINSDSVKIRPFVSGDQRHLAKQTDSYRGYFSLLSRLVLSPEKLAFDELLLGDINAMLFAVRLRSFGPNFDVDFSCEMCQAKNHQIADLNNVMVRQADEFENFKAEGLEIELNGKAVTIRLPRLKDEKKLIDNMKSLKVKGNRVSDSDIDRSYVRLMQAIETIDGKKPILVEAFDFVDNLPIPDIERFGQFLNEHDIGIIKEQKLTCDTCQFENTITLGISAEFFRPSRASASDD